MNRYSRASTGVATASVLVLALATAPAAAGVWRAGHDVAGAAVVIWVLASLPRSGLAERVFLAISLALAAVAALVLPAPMGVLAPALDRACLFIAYIVAVNLLRDAATTARSIRDAGRVLIHQPPPRRYLTLSFGAHLLSIVLNMGAVNLLGAMIMRSNTLAAAGGDPDILAIRLKRMSSALIRGFSTMVLWSPTGVSVALTLSLFPSITWFDLAPAALPFAVGFMLIGWVVDRLQYPPALRRAIPMANPPPARLALPMLGITAGLIAAVITTKLVAIPSILVAVLVTVPIFAAAWIALQYRRLGARAALVALGRRLRRHVAAYLPQMRPEATMLGTASFIGVVLSGLLDSAGLSAWIAALGLPPLALGLAAGALVIAGTLVAVSPLVTGTVLGTALVEMDPAPLAPLVLAVLLQCSWAISSALSPFGGSTLLLGRIIRKNSWIFLRWNAAYAAACFAVMATAFAVWIGG